MLDQEISRVLRLITADPTILSYHDNQQLLNALLSRPLPTKYLKDVSNHLETQFNLYRRNTVFTVGDDLVENYYWWTLSAGRTVHAGRQGKLLDIKLEPVTNGSSRPEDIVIDGIPHLRRYYIACIGDGWDSSSVNHQWSKWDRYPEIKTRSTSPDWSGYDKVMNCIEGVFRSCWFRLQDYQGDL